MSLILLTMFNQIIERYTSYYDPLINTQQKIT